MKHLILIPILAPLVIAACVPIEPTCGQPNEPVVIGTAKDGNLIYDDQAPLNAPCPTVTVRDTQTPPIIVPPVVRPPVEPPEEPPIVVASNSKHPNSGRGNGSELGSDRRDIDPGRSGGHNRGGD